MDSDCQLLSFKVRIDESTTDYLATLGTSQNSTNTVLRLSVL